MKNRVKAKQVKRISSANAGMNAFLTNKKYRITSMFILLFYPFVVTRQFKMLV